MIDLCLRAGNAGAFASACPFLRGDGQWLTSGDGFSLDVIGSVITTPGSYDDEGAELTPPVLDNRFHANLRCTEEIAAMVSETFVINPTTPMRVWA